jgi:predicted transcriptional regulator
MATLLELVTEIVSSHASISALSTDDLVLEIQKVHSTLQVLESGQKKAVSAVEEGKPSLSIKNAFKKNEVVCMICGKVGMKTLTRHLSKIHSLKPGEYRKQFGIPSKQPLTAKSYSESRRKMAEERGLGNVLAKAREARTAKLKEKVAAPAKPAKKAVSAKPAKAKITKPRAAKKAAKPKTTTA